MHLLTPWCRVLLEKLTGLQLVKKFPAFHALISQIYFWNKFLHVSDSSSVHRQEFFTVHTAMPYVVQFRPDPARKPVWHIPLLCVQWETHDDGQRNCPKHVEFDFKNKFEKLVHLVGFIIRIDLL